MVKSQYDWDAGAQLNEHSARKLKVLREYFSRYLKVRCNLPVQSQFRLAIVDGFAGGGRYRDGEAGSPLVFLEVLSQTIREVRESRAAQGFRPMTFQCRLILNDESVSTAELLRSYAEPVAAAVREDVPELDLQVEFHAQAFECLYPSIRQRLLSDRLQNVIFNLDQYGDAAVRTETIRDILGSFRSGEVFLTFMISSLLAFLSKQDPVGLLKRLNHLNVRQDDILGLQGAMTNQRWLGAAERIVFEQFASAAAFVSPFSIHNPKGWDYWLIHFANVSKARQVYNDVLHDNATMQAHFGRSGLDMLAYDPEQEGALYLFDTSGRSQALEQLMEDVPRMVASFGDTVPVSAFNHTIYNLTPAHSDDIKRAILESPEIEIITESGGGRRSAHRIADDDILRLTRQQSFFRDLKPRKG